MANASAYRVLGEFWANDKQPETYKLTYNFANDTGAQGTYTLGKVIDKCIVLGAVVQVETACTSGASATVKIGTSSGDDDAFCTVTSGAVANLADDFTVRETAGQKLVIAENENINLVIGTADLTAGKINVYLTLAKAV